MLREVHERDGYPTYWPADPERFVAGDRTLSAWVAERDGQLVGHAALAGADAAHVWPAWCEATGRPSEGLGVIARFYVAPQARGSGAAGALFDVAVAEARRRGLAPVLDVTPTNAAGIGFYERRGWRRVGSATLALRDPPGATLAMLLYVAPDDGVDIGELEDVAARAVPPAEVAPLGGWLLRATPAVGTRRANSVLARADDPTIELTTRIAAAEDFYARRGQPSRFQITPVSAPAELAGVLADRGYVRESPTLVCCGATATIAHAEPDRRRTAPQVTVADVPDATWRTTWCDALAVDPARQAGPAALWRRIEPECGYALVRVDGEPAGVGMAVRDGRWVGVFNMATRATHRRRGVARAALRALAAWGAAGGAERAYLQVDEANDAARALYAEAGIDTVYEYAYLVRA